MMDVKNKFSLTSLAVCGLLVCSSCAAQAPNPSTHRWTQFVQVEGQPEPVPAEWVVTPEGKFAHSIKIPNPVPKDSGYRKGMTSEQYFEHLCKTEAGEFIYKTVDNVEGFYFMRPPKRPTDDDLIDRYKLEAPEIERTFQLLRATPQERGGIFIGPPWKLYSFVEEPAMSAESGKSYVRIFGYKQDFSPMKTELVSELKSHYGLIWRGLNRPNDRELAIAGNEWIVIDLKTNEVLAVQRNYGRTGFNRNTEGGIWWLNALGCPNLNPVDNLPSRFYKFAIKSLKPVLGDKK
ncbi:MAG TPA: hypothetical protein VIW72_04920 [Burkholderiales bacterium]